MKRTYSLFVVVFLDFPKVNLGGARKKNFWNFLILDTDTMHVLGYVKSLNRFIHIHFFYVGCLFVDEWHHEIYWFQSMLYIKFEIWIYENTKSLKN